MTETSSLPERTAWTVRPRPNPAARLQLLCIPHAGAGASSFNPWPRLLPPEVELVAVQLPGREGRAGEPAHLTLPPLLEGLVEGLAGVLDRPFVIFGHSMGGALGFELARALEAQGRAGPEHLFIAAARGASLSHAVGIDTEDDEQLLRGIAGLGEMTRFVVEHPRWAKRLLPLYRADFTLVQTYQAAKDARVRCGISALGGLDDALVAREQLAAWQPHTEGWFELRQFPGDHFFPRTAPAVVVEHLVATVRARGLL